MKKILALAAALVIVAGAAANDRPIRIDQLPKKAQHFIKEYFAAHQVSYAKYDNELSDQNYEVVFTDGTNIEFNRKGEWRHISCKRGASVPTDLLPQSIVGYLRQNHPDINVVEVERDRHEWELQLAGGLELIFDKRGHLKYYD